MTAIIPTGDEIRPVGSALGPGDVTDSNSLLLASRARETGARPLISDVQPDDPDAIAAAAWNTRPYFRILTARATTRIPTTSEIVSSAIIMSFAHGLIAETSVGLNAIEVL